jgi:hypothetical protein
VDAGPGGPDVGTPEPQTSAVVLSGIAIAKDLVEVQMSRSRCLVAIAVFFAGCYVEPVPTYSAVEVTAAPYGYETYPHTYYEGHTVYWYGGGWYYHDGGRWMHYRSEPAPLYQWRTQAPPAPRGYAPGYAPPAVRTR